MAFNGSFAYTALPKELLEMSAELDALGGGDTRVAAVEGYCKVYPSNDDMNTNMISVDHDRGVITVRDPRASGTTPHAKGVRKYKVNSIIDHSNHSNLGEISATALNWLWDGFNTNVISLGQTGSSKSFSLWGRVTSTDDSILPVLLQELFSRINSESGSYRVGISCWDILGNDIVDLFSTDHSKSQNFGRKFGVHTARSVITVNASTLDNATNLIDLARSKSVNWTTATATNRPEFIPNRAHHFVRIVLHNVNAGWVSCLHIGDLVGHGRTPAHAPPFNHGDLERERRVARQQLVGFGRIIAELAKTPEGKTEAGPTLVSARDSVLSQLLGPLITTNSKTFILTCVSPHKEDFAETMHSLQFVKRAQAITVGCARTQGVDEASLTFTNEDEVLTLDQVWPTPNGQAPSPILAPRHPSPRASPRRGIPTTPTVEDANGEDEHEDEEVEDEPQPRQALQKQASHQPMTKQPSHQPLTKQASHQPMTKQPSHQPLAKQPSQSHQPLAKQPSQSSQPMTKQPSHQPVTKQPSQSLQKQASHKPAPQKLDTQQTAQQRSPQQSPQHHLHIPHSPHQPPPLHQSPRHHHLQQSPSHPQQSPTRHSQSQRSPRSPTARSPRNNESIDEDERNKSILSVNDLQKGFDVSEKRKRKEALARASAEGFGGQAKPDNNSASSIKMKMRNMIDVLENDGDEVVMEDEEERAVQQPVYYNNNKQNGKHAEPEYEDHEEGEIYEEHEDDAYEHSNARGRAKPHHTRGGHVRASHGSPTQDLNSSMQMAELVLLKKNYESVLKALDRAEALKAQFADQAAEAEHRVTEIQLTYQLQLDQVIGENMQLRALVRKMEQTSDFAEVFEVYERDMGRIGNELKRLREENLSLYDKIETFTENPTAPAPVSATSMLKKKIHSNSASHASTLLTQEIEEMKADSQRQERKHMLMQRALEEASKQLSALGTAASNKDEFIKRLKMDISHLENRLADSHAESDALRGQISALKAQIDAEGVQLDVLQTSLENMREEYIFERKSEIMSRITTTPSGRDSRSERERAEKGGKVGVITQSITQLFERLHELDMVDPKYATLLKKLKKEIEKLEAEFAVKETEQQKLITLCLENMPQTDSYMKNIAKFKEILGSNSKVLSKMKASFH